MRLTLAIVGCLVAAAGGLIAHGTRASVFTFEPTPLQLSVAIAPEWTAEATFRIGRAGEYEVQFDCLTPPGLRPPDSGAWDDAVQSPRIAWEVLTGSRQIASGSSEAYPANWYGGGNPHRSGRDIGRFDAGPGTYTLRLAVRGGDGVLNLHAPRVSVQLNGQDLTDLSHAEELREILHPVGRWVALAGAAIVAVALLSRVVERRAPAGSTRQAGRMH